MISFGGWDRLFAVNHEVYRGPTLEVLSTFEADRSAVREKKSTAITFQLFGRQYQMDYTTFSLHMGLYDHDYTYEREYKNLLTAFPESTITSPRYWLKLGGRYNTNKASLMADPLHRYLHALLSRTIAGRSDNCGVVIVTERLFLYSLIERVPIHLGYALADYLSHQGQNIKLTDIHAGPYITRLIMGMGLEAELQEEEPLHLMAPLDMTTLVQMRLVRRIRGRYTLVGQPSDSSEEDASDSASEDSAPEEPAGSPPRAPRSRLARVEDRLEEISTTQATLLEEHRQMRAQLTELSLFLREHPAFAPPPPPASAADDTPATDI